MTTTIVKRENYCKYAFVHDRLLQYLEKGTSARWTASALRISLPTYYKYKSMISIEQNKIYAVKEEKAFLEKEENRRRKLLSQKNNTKISQ
jgi:DNA invertase Pin-like site-specific DNA recombinase